MTSFTMRLWSSAVRATLLLECTLLATGGHDAATFGLGGICVAAAAMGALALRWGLERATKARFAFAPVFISVVVAGVWIREAVEATARVNAWLLDSSNLLSSDAHV
jgi:hypothetical protein